MDAEINARRAREEAQTYKLDPEPGLRLCDAHAALSSRTPMKTPPLDPHIADVAPAGPALTEYDKEHMITYMRVLDADQQGADWRRCLSHRAAH
jgi:hypothetical protein